MSLERQEPLPPHRFAPPPPPPPVDSRYESDAEQEVDNDAEEEPVDDGASTIAEQHEEPMWDEDEKPLIIEVRHCSGKKHWLFILLATILVVVLATIWAVSSAETSRKAKAAPMKSSGPLNLPPCFISVATKNADKEEPSHSYDWCDESKARVPCPIGGTCSNGQLIKCDDPYDWLVSKAGDQCILSATFKQMQMLARVEKDVANKTTDHLCSIQAGGINTAIDTSPKLFDISLFIGTSQELRDLVLSSDAFIFDTNEDGSTMIGLSDKNIRLPLKCRYRISYIHFMEYIEPYVRHAACSIWVFTKFNPYLPPFLSVVVIIVAMTFWYQQCKPRHED